MALSLQELEEMRDTLIRNRAKGVRSGEIGDEKVQFGSDAEMARAIADLDARISNAGRSRPKTIRFSASKGS